FFTGVLTLYLLVRLFGWLPPLEFVSFTVSPVENLKQLIWPALAQAYYISAPITRLTRSQLLEVIRQDYVRTARAKGLGERAVVYRHALSNSLLPRSEEHTSELQSRVDLVCRLLLEKKKNKKIFYRAQL